MREALSIALAGLVIVVPVEQVLGQAVQQEAVSLQQAPSTGAAARLLRVPPLTENAARLLRTPSQRALTDTELPDALLVQEGRGGTMVWGWRNVLIVIGVIGVLGIAALIIRS